jgi:putative ABC transport system permease protein
MVSPQPPYHDPPQRLLRLLRWFCAESFMEEIEGDLFELFQEEVEEYGLKRARRRFFFTALRYINPYFYGKKTFLDHLSHQPDMLKHYFKISLRRLVKQRFYALINVLGLAIGMACCITVLLFVHDESSYDQYHEDSDQMYRLAIQSVLLSSGDEQQIAVSPVLWAPALKKDYPEVTGFARFVSLTEPDDPWALTAGEHTFQEKNILYADPSALELFNWPLLQGTVENALTQPHSVVITESMAEKYFGDADPMGKTLQLDPRRRGNDGRLTGETIEYTVSGVLEDVPRHSHFTFDFLLPSIDLNEVYGGDINTGANLNNWYWRGLVAHTYLKIKEGMEPAALEKKFAEFQDRYLGDATRSRGYYYVPYLQPLEEIYLAGDMAGQLQTAGNRNYMYMFSLVAFFVLLIACINFMNLATARSALRAKEVGLRKVVGAQRAQLISQFLSESVLISLAAFLLALLIAYVALPPFYQYLEKEWAIDYSREAPFLISLFLLGLAVGIFAGSYPAFILSRFRPAQVLRGLLPKYTSGAFVRKGLVIFQFVISAFLIIGTLTVFKQLRFMRNHDLGFDQERVLVLPPDVGLPLSSQYEAVKEELLSLPQIADVTMASGVPGQGGGGELYAAKGAGADEGFGLGELFVDHNYTDLFGLQVIAGRVFSKEMTTDQPIRNEEGRIREVKTVINEAAVKQFGWSSPQEAIGKQIIRDPNAVDWTATVIGVVKDFHFQSLQQEIQPGALILLPSYSHMAIKLKEGDPGKTLAAVEEKVKEFTPELTFNYNFLDETFREQYEFEQSLGEIFSYISSLAIFIACLGLLGLAAFTTTRRIKEIGIRKTLGASISDIVLLLSKDFTKLVIVAVLLAIPLAYWATERWLEEFAYRIPSNWSTYIFAGLLAIAIAWLTISFQTVRAARRNPVQSLQSE